MKKKTPKKTVKAIKPASKKPAAKKAAAKKPAAKQPVKKSKPVAKKVAPAKKKVAPKAKVVKGKVNKQKIEPKKVMKKPEPKKVEVKKKAPVIAPKVITKPVAAKAPVVEPKHVEVAPKIEAPKMNGAAKEEQKRYSEKELAEFRTLIVDKLDQARKDYDLLKNTLCHTDDHGTDDTSPTFKALEDGSDVLTREETAQLALRQEKFIQNLQNALVRIQNKTYGICRVTGKLIPKERLRRVPHATLSIDAKLVQQFNQ